MPKELNKKIKTHIQNTLMLKRFFLKFAIRVSVFLVVLIFYLHDKELMTELVVTPFWSHITPLHVLWAMFMVMMILHIFPPKTLSMAMRKSKSEEYDSVDGYDELEMHRFVQKMNSRAWIVMLVWLCGNAVFGVLYLFGVIDNVDLLMITVFFFLCDYICILIYCPFQSLIMKNRCCVNCRIYDWGHFMMFTPMLFIRNFFSWSLFFTSCIVLIKWEIQYSRHPEYFWHGSNKKLKCENCKDKICKVKGKVLEK